MFCASTTHASAIPLSRSRSADGPTHRRGIHRAGREPGNEPRMGTRSMRSIGRRLLDPHAPPGRPAHQRVHHRQVGARAGRSDHPRTARPLAADAASQAALHRAAPERHGRLQRGAEIGRARGRCLYGVHQDARQHAAGRGAGAARCRADSPRAPEAGPVQLPPGYAFR